MFDANTDAFDVNTSQFDMFDREYGVPPMEMLEVERLLVVRYESVELIPLMVVAFITPLTSRSYKGVGLLIPILLNIVSA